MNELICLAVLILGLAGIVVFYKLFGKMGLYVWLALAIIVANIQAVKLVNVFGLETALGTIIYSTTFLVINIIFEKYGKKEARKALWVSVAAMITVTLLMGLSVLYEPSSNDTANESLNLIFSINIRIFVGSIIAYVVSQFCNMAIYAQIKGLYHKPWRSNCMSTIIGQLVDTVIFSIIAFAGVYSFAVLVEIFTARYFFKLVMIAAGTPVLYAIINKEKED